MHDKHFFGTKWRNCGFFTKRLLTSTPFVFAATKQVDKVNDVVATPVNHAVDDARDDVNKGVHGETKHGDAKKHDKK